MTDTRALARHLNLLADVLESDPVGQAARTRIEQFGPMEGTAGELLTLLTPDRAPKGWPLTPQGMAAALRRLAPSLREVGIEVTYGRRGHEGRRVYELARAVDESERGADESSAPSAVSATVSTAGQDDLLSTGADGADDADIPVGPLSADSGAEEATA